MNLYDIKFNFDLSKKMFKRISLNIEIEIHENVDFEEKKKVVLKDFKELESFFEKHLSSFKMIKKETDGNEYESFINAGYTYRSEQLFGGIRCQLRYFFGIREGKAQIPTMEAEFEIPDNMNYWMMENFLGTFCKKKILKISEKAQNNLKRIRQKMKEHNDIVTPQNILAEFFIAEKPQLNKLDNQVKVNNGNVFYLSEKMGINEDLYKNSILKIDKELPEIVRKDNKKHNYFSLFPIKFFVFSVVFFILLLILIELISKFN